MSYKILDKDNSNYQCANLKMYILASPPAPLLKERGVASALCHRCWLVEISPLAFRRGAGGEAYIFKNEFLISSKSK